MENLTDADRENWVRYHLPRASMVPHRRAPPARRGARPYGRDVRRRRQAAASGLAVHRSEAAAGRAERLSPPHARALCLDHFRQLDGFIERLVTGRRAGSASLPRLGPRFHGNARSGANQRPPRREGLAALEGCPTPTRAADARTACSPTSTGRARSPTAARPRTTASTSASPACRPDRSAAWEYQTTRAPDPRPPNCATRPARRAHHRRDPSARGRIPRCSDGGCARPAARAARLRIRLDQEQAAGRRAAPEVAGTHHPTVSSSDTDQDRAGQEDRRRQIMDVGATCSQRLGLPVPSVSRASFPRQCSRPSTRPSADRSWCGKTLSAIASDGAAMAEGRRRRSGAVADAGVHGVADADR